MIDTTIPYKRTIIHVRTDIANLNLRLAATKYSRSLAILHGVEALLLLSVLDNGWLKVTVNEKIGYVDRSYTDFYSYP